MDGTGLGEGMERRLSRDSLLRTERIGDGNGLGMRPSSDEGMNSERKGELGSRPALGIETCILVAKLGVKSEWRRVVATHGRR